MKKAAFVSDYSPHNILSIVQTDDCDIVIKTTIRDERDKTIRIATSGGKLHGEKLVKVGNLFSQIIDLLNE